MSDTIITKLLLFKDILEAIIIESISITSLKGNSTYNN